MTGTRNFIAPFKMSVCGIEELASHCAVGISHVLSILDPDWPVPEAFGSFGEHAKLELRFHDIIDAQGGRNDRTPARARGGYSQIWPRVFGATRRGHASAGALPCRRVPLHGSNDAYPCSSYARGVSQSHLSGGVVFSQVIRLGEMD
jgi:hypothetical protein